MITKDNKSYYRGWIFRDDVPLIPRDAQWLKYFDNKFGEIDIDVDIDTDGMTETIVNAIETNLEPVHTHIDQTEEDIINAMTENATTINNNITSAKEEIETNINNHIDEAKCHLCCKIQEAKNNINNHIDEKLEPLSNLNEQVNEILNRLN